MTFSSDASSSRLSTPVKLLLLLLLLLAPIAGLLTWSATQEVHQHNQAIEAKFEAMRQASVQNIEGLVARNALALRIAANGAFAARATNPCEAAQTSLEITPALSQDFAIANLDGDIICGDPALFADRTESAVERGEIDVRIGPIGRGLILEVGVANGAAASYITAEELRDSVGTSSDVINTLILISDDRRLPVIGEAGGSMERYELAGGRMAALVATDSAQLTMSDRLLIFLPVFLLLAAILLSWFLVHRLLLRPLRRLTRAIGEYDPDQHGLEMPARLGPASEIRDLGAAFSTAVGRLEASEEEAAGALEGQRRLVREVHHRVKNNLQVVASLLSIHSRGATGQEAQAAYAGIGRRVEALAVVHRNHFAEVEESRGIQLRPLITELGSSLRASSVNPAGTSPIDLDLASASTTQDVAVAAAFLITEVVEYILDHGDAEPIEIRLDRTSEITARLTIASEALVADKDNVDRATFDRIVDGLARQLRSPLEKRLGRYSVELPIFAED